MLFFHRIKKFDEPFFFFATLCVKWQCGQNKKPFAVVYRPARRRKMKKGFTLIELLVVVLIIGILSAVALPQYRKAVFKAKLTEMNVILNTYQKGITSYLLANGGYPSTTTYFTGTRDSGALDIQMPATGKDSTSSCNGKLNWSVSCRSSYCSVLMRMSNAKGDTCATAADTWIGEIVSRTRDAGKTWELSGIYISGEQWKAEILCQWGKSIDENFGTGVPGCM